MEINDAQKKLLLLQEAFIKNLPLKISDIENAWKNIKQKWQEDKITLLHRLVHNLKGSTGTYGHQDLSQSCANLEKNIERFLSRPPTPDEIPKTEKKLNDLKRRAENIKLPSYPEKLSKSLVVSKETRAIYLLDNDESFTHQISNELKAFQYQVKHFTELKAVEKAFEKQTPFALIVDISFFQNANANANANAKQIISDIETYPHLMIVTTNNSDFEKHLIAVRAGCADYLVKPFAIEELINKFDRYTQRTESKYTILIIEDTIEVAQYYSVLLQECGMNAYILTNPRDINKALIEYRPDLILMDIYMPECNGLELTTMIRQQEKYTSIPIIFLSSEEDREKQLKAMSLGVDDFITKSTKSEFVILAIKNCAERYRLLTSLIMKDGLTGIFNHSTIRTRLNETIKEASRLDTSVAIAMIDLDDFKSVNDNYGHMRGDRVLKNLCFLLRKRLRETDLIGRYGGEEFLVVFPSTTAKQAKNILNEIRKEFSHVDYSHKNNTFNVTFSAGISEYPYIENKDELIQCADKSLYEAKKKGKNKICYLQS